MNPPICKECHCQPSARWDATGLQCYCTCHDLADAAPDLLSACREALEELGDGKDPDTPAMRTIRAAIAKAEGQS